GVMTGWDRQRKQRTHRTGGPSAREPLGRPSRVPRLRRSGGALRCFERGIGTAHAGKLLEKLAESVSCLQVIQKRLKGHACPAKYGFSAENLRILNDHAFFSPHANPLPSPNSISPSERAHRVLFASGGGGNRTRRTRCGGRANADLAAMRSWGISCRGTWFLVIGDVGRRSWRTATGMEFEIRFCRRSAIRRW